MKKPIYLDYMATTPVDPRVVVVMQSCLTQEGHFANPDSHTHVLGHQAKKVIEHAREQVALLINARENEIVWTSGATEANNLAIKGAAYFNLHKGRHIITCKTEHKSVLDTCRYLEKKDFEVTYLDVDAKGLIDITQLQQAIRPDTILVSIMYVNNEIGVIQDIEAIGQITRDKGIVFHVDAVQACGKVLLDMQHSNIDLMSLSAHKVYGPKGIGALYIRSQPRVRIQPQLHGGGQQGGMRPGTLPTHQIAGMGEAFFIAYQEMGEEVKRIQQMHDYFWQELSKIEAVFLNGDAIRRVPHNLNVCFKYVDAESLMMELSDLAFSSGSACNSIVTEASYVLRALGLSEIDAYSSVRFSLGRFTTLDEIQYAIHTISKAVKRLRELSPLWESYKHVSQC